MEHQNNIFKDSLLALFCCFLWGACVPLIKIAYNWFQIGSADTASQMTMAGIRFTLAGLLIIIGGRFITGKWLKPSMQTIPLIVKLALVQTSIHYFFFFSGLSKTIGVRSTVITATTTFWVLLFSSLIFKLEKITTFKLIGCIIGFAGVAYMNLAGTSLAGKMTFAGEGFVLISAIIFAFSNILVRLYGEKENPITLSGYQMTLGGIILFAAGKIGSGTLRPVRPEAWIVLAMLAAMSAMCYGIWTSLLSRNNPSKIASFKLSEPLFGVILSAIILNEASKVSWGKCIFALVLVSIGILITTGTVFNNKNQN